MAIKKIKSEGSFALCVRKAIESMDAVMADATKSIMQEPLANFAICFSHV